MSLCSAVLGLRATPASCRPTGTRRHAPRTDTRAESPLVKMKPPGPLRGVIVRADARYPYPGREAAPRPFALENRREGDDTRFFSMGSRLSTAHLVFQVFRELLRAVEEGVVVTKILLHGGTGLADLLLQRLGRLLRGRQFRADLSSCSRVKSRCGRDGAHDPLGWMMHAGQCFLSTGARMTGGSGLHPASPRSGFLLSPSTSFRLVPPHVRSSCRPACYGRPGAPCPSAVFCAVLAISRCPGCRVREQRKRSFNVSCPSRQPAIISFVCGSMGHE